MFVKLHELISNCWNKREFDETEVFGVVIVGCNCIKKQTTDEKKLAKYDNR
jgi:hypothetical protein